MRKLFIFLAIVGLLLPATQGMADPLIRQVAVIYEDRLVDPILGWSNMNSGGGVWFAMKTMPGFDETNIEHVTVTHTRLGGDKALYRVERSPCLEYWPTFDAERNYILRLGIPGWQVGTWRFSVKEITGQIETRFIPVNFFTTPTPPSNVAFLEQPNGDMLVEWDAAVGPPASVDPASLAHYQIVFYGPEAENHCAWQNILRSGDPEFSYDSVRNRVSFLVPVAWRDQRVRLHNVLASGGGVAYFPNPQLLHHCRGALITWIP
jgi:hypothetical protein